MKTGHSVIAHIGKLIKEVVCNNYMEKHPLWKGDKLGAHSEIYHMDSDTYEAFSQAEDKPNKILAFLKSKLKNKIVLDLGCGTGKFITDDLVPLTKYYYGIELYDRQLQIAQEKSKKFENIKLIKSSAENIPLENNSVDVIFVSWVIGSIHNLSIRKKVVQEMQRVLKNKGSIYLIENDIGGEFKNLIEEGFGDKKTKIKIDWLKKNGFVKIKSIKTHFEFKDIQSAKRIFEKIWDKKIASKIKSNRISHNVAIYKNEN